MQYSATTAVSGLRPVLGAGLLVIAGLLGCPLFAGDVLAQLAPGTWYEAPDSHLESVKPNPLPPGSSGIASVMAAWSGGCFDTKRERLLVWGGGHGDYAGNELYAFDTRTLKWSIVAAPTPNDKIPDIKLGQDPYTDGKPASRHTYDELEYLPTQDQFWACNGGIWSPGVSSKKTWVFDFAAAKWQAKADVPEGCHTQTVYDPVTQHIFAQLNVAFCEYDPVKDTWTQRGRVGGGVWKTNNAVIDPQRRLFVTVGAKSIACWNLKTFERTVPATTGDKELEEAPAPGIDYDPVVKKFVAWNGGSAVYVLDPDTWVWTKLPAAPGNKVTPTAATKAGIYGRWRYIPGKDIFIGVNATRENVFFYKLGALPKAGGKPAAPAAPASTATATKPAATKTAPPPIGRTGLANGAPRLPAPTPLPASLNLEEEDTSDSVKR